MKKTVVTIVSLILSVGSIALAEGDNIKKCPFAVAASLTEDTKESFSQSFGSSGSGHGLGSGRSSKVRK